MRTATAQIVRTPLHEEVTNRIRDMIVESRLVPGERIQEMQLAQQLGVSRTPIREALKVLTSEGLVELLPLRGAIVKAFTGKDARDMLDVIAWLEAFAGERACQAEQPRIDAILAMHAHMEELYARRQRLEYFVLNQEIHGTTVRLDPMPAASALSRLTVTSSVEHPVVDVLIEVPRGSFLKRDPEGRIHFISPLPCPYNYGAVPAYLGLEGDLLDVVVLGPRLPFGTRKRLRAWGAITLTDRGESDDKLICSERPPTAQEIRRLLQFFRFYARCKALLNRWRGRPGRNACEGWRDASDAMARATPLPDRWSGPSIRF